MSFLLLTVRFLDDRYHGLLDRGGPPEWPPSPFRLFQALVAGVARRGELVDGDDVPSNTNFTDVGKALGWLQRHTAKHPPIIITPKSKTGQAITRFVPNNDGDKKFDRQERLTAKHTEPTLFLLDVDQKPEVHYVWDISSSDNAPVDLIRDAARSVTTLGWGIDMAFADAGRKNEVELQSLKGIRWYPKQDACRDEGMLRTPTYDDDEMRECTLCDLRHCHDSAMNRIEHGKPLKTVDKPRAFDRVLYTSTERPIGRPTAVFKLLAHDHSPGDYAHARLIHIAGMVRHLAIGRMSVPPGWIDGPKWLETFVCGHQKEGEQHRQISYVPLPSIGHEHADAEIRNVMLITPLGFERELEFVAEQLNGEELKPEGQIHPTDSEHSLPIPGPMFLDRFTPPRGKFIATRYLGTSNVWQTVTPVILDGHNKKTKSDKPEAVARETEKLICKALHRAGIETPCKFTWQSFPYLKNCLSAHKYDRHGRHAGYHRPKHLKELTAMHIRITFDYPVHGPLTIGAGRHCGFGLLATASD